MTEKLTPPGLDALMRQVLAMAAEAARQGTAPFAALVIDSRGTVVGEGINGVLAHSDPTAHAEMEALRDAGAKLGRPRLSGFSVIASGEPCAMCAIAMRTAGIDGVVYGMTRDQAAAAGYDYRAGYDLLDQAALHREMPSRAHTVTGMEALIEEWARSPVTF